MDLLYGNPDDPSVAGLQKHLESCANCRGDLGGLQQVRKLLGAWEDEPPLRPFVLPAAPAKRWQRPLPWYLLRAAAAAVLLLAVLGLANAEISWTADGFSLRTRLFESGGTDGKHYTKEEVRDLLKVVLNDSEARMSEANFLMMQRMMDTIAAERKLELRLVGLRSENSRTKN